MKPFYTSLVRRFGKGGLAVAFVLSAVGGMAYAITDSQFRYSTLQTGYLTINSFGFAPDGGNPTASYVNAETGGLSSSVSDQCWTASVHLPQGAKIVRLTVWFKTYTLVQFHRITLDTGANSILASHQLSDNSNTRVSRSPPINPIDVSAQDVDNANHTYGLFICPHGTANGVFYAARITYRYRNAGD
jgi:hypothetical protein